MLMTNVYIDEDFSGTLPTLASEADDGEVVCQVDSFSVKDLLRSILLSLSS